MTDEPYSTRTGAVSTEPKPTRSPEYKVSQKFIEGINTLDFEPKYVAMAFALAPTVIQVRLMAIFRLWIDVLEAEYNDDRHRNNEHYDLQVTAKRINDGMLPFEE